MYDDRLPSDDQRYYESVMWHRSTPRRFLRMAVSRVQTAARVGHEQLRKIGDLLFRFATDTRMLHASWCRMASRGGQSPGPNGHRYCDTSAERVWPLIRLMSDDLRRGKYRVGRSKPVSFWKDPNDRSRGVRTIHLLNIEDRVVQRAVAEVLQPIIECIVGPNVFGFRSERNVADAFLAAERHSILGGRWVWVADDLKTAFDRVPRERLRDVVEKNIPCHALADLVMQLVSTCGKRGIPQGGPLSPLLLNLYLHHFLDRVWAERHPDVPLLRYADDLLLLCRTEPEAAGCWSDLSDILRPTGMLLKGKSAIEATTCLEDRAAVRWLGARISREHDHLRFRIADSAFSRLRSRLERVHHFPNAPLRANACVAHWLQALGPCYDGEKNRSRILEKVERTLRACGFDELPGREVFRSAWRKGRETFAAQRSRQFDTTASIDLPPTASQNSK